MSLALLAAEAVSHSSFFAEVIAVIAAIIGSAAGGIATWYGVRRKTSGRIGTSDADILWQQSAQMRDSLLAQLTKTTEQRDRLIDSQAGSILPMIAGMVTTLKELEMAIVAIGERLGRDEVLQIQGTATSSRPESASPAGEGERHGNRPAGQAGG